MIMRDREFEKQRKRETEKQKTVKREDTEIMRENE